MPQPAHHTSPASASWALISGGSSGIGREYAEQLAGNYGYNLFLVSNQEEALLTTKEQLQSRYGVEVRTVYTDLAAPEAAEDVYNKVQETGADISVLINNAGFLVFDAFVSVPLHRLQDLVSLQTLTLTSLCRLFAADWIKQTADGDCKRRYILNMSSMSAWMSVPSIQCYNASKAYVLNLTKSLWYELKPFDIRVMALAPGSTDTGLLPFPPRMASLFRKTGITMPPERLVSKALHKLFRSSRKTYMPGAWNKIIVPVISHLPDLLVFAVMKRMKMFDKQSIINRIP